MLERGPDRRGQHSQLLPGDRRGARSESPALDWGDTVPAIPGGRSGRHQVRQHRERSAARCQNQGWNRSKYGCNF